MGFQWDPAKASANLRKHGVDFADAVGVFDDPLALTARDPALTEERLLSLGQDMLGRVIVVNWTCEARRSASFPRGGPRRANDDTIRRDTTMRKEYDFAGARRGPVVPAAKGKTRITIRLDDDILDWFRQQVDDAGGGNYQTLINEALCSFMHQKQESLETTLRRVIREEIRRAG